MNKHILMVIDHQLNPGKYTQEQLKDNALAADAADAASAFASTLAASALASDWVDIYFERSGENKDDYIKELNK